MKMHNLRTNSLLALATVVMFSIGFGAANATQPCGDFGECKVLVEINSTDGDIGLHFLGDGDDLIVMKIKDPKGRVIFKENARGALRKQFLTETFVESAEPLCWEDPEEEDLDDIVTLEEFIDRWTPGVYKFIGFGKKWERSVGRSELTFELPAAPQKLTYEEEEEDGDVEGEISWEAGDDLGNCADRDSIESLLSEGILPMDPADVEVAVWEVVFEPEFEDDDPNAALSLKHVVRIAAKDDDGEDVELEVEISSDYLETLPDDTLVKIEVGAIGFDDNATFTEVGDICVNEDEGCED